MWVKSEGFIRKISLSQRENFDSTYVRYLRGNGGSHGQGTKEQEVVLWGRVSVLQEKMLSRWMAMIIIQQHP